MRNRFRREMALNFWIPDLYRGYLAARRRLGSIRRRMGGAAA
jgi:hypothetical protein